MIRKPVAALMQSILVAGLTAVAAPAGAQGQAAGYPRQTVTITVV